ncbi:chemotaxis protein CheW [Leptospira bandrabouensis]|uniref:chemotaxis protein CheW n=1 Tax=Leptospira bandrabouensis TaxID=2484903 RepID=UPI001EE953D9|nr:chemotaxis protein CheW [Leptospira bandrabouensis]MCG6145710.1 chemotaxis protein CheW [Leptospira bandrabouensis]MCG6160747.1 chemotaxis protein CheW [Leptospira bandrabouensis]MCG6165288.1 chemotaxis protein CheW [Leptospira bandrabouensis]
MAGILGEYTEVFLEESEDQIEELNSNLVKLEKDHENPEIINDIFRAAHSLKSSSAFVGLYNLSDLAHTMENLLQKIREGSLEINVKLVNLLFECFDLIKQVIEGVANGVKVETPFTDMIKKLQDYEASPSQSGSGSNPALKSNEPAKSKENSPSSITLNEEEISEIRQSLKEDSGQTAYSVSLKLKDETPMQNLRLLLILQSVKQSGVIIKCNPSEDALDNGQGSFALSFVTVTKLGKHELHVQCNIDMVDTLSIEEIKLPETEMDALEKREENSSQTTSANQSTGSLETEEKLVTKGSANFDKAVTDSKVVMRTIKVSSDKLDQLMNNVGELVITNSGFQKIYDDLVAQFGEDSLFNELKGKIDQINRISKDLQTGIMNIRMVPIGSVFNRFTRLIRDLSLETGKQVNLVLRGENTELDKKVIDAIGEPLIHLIRNSVDHGIESPAERRASGKPEEGTVELNAYQGGSNILVEIRDDGKGLNKEKILKKAIERGLVNESDAQNLAESDIFQFIFAPGFSTADKISDISGRGVGMNVVNKLIEEFKGKILIHSEEGKGSSFTLSFPQALAIIPSILVIMEEEVYAFPLSEVSETIKVNLDQITTLEGHEIINLRGEVLPIYRLNRILGLADKQEMVEVPVVIVNYKTRKLGFMVDDLIGKHETVIKSLGKNFKDIQGLTGATIMGDGTIILVLDIPGLVEIAADKVDWTDKLVAGEMMKRASTIRSLEMSDSEFMFKSNHPTNRYNAKLIELRAKDKSRVKKDKHKVEKHVIVPKEEVFTEEPVTNPKIKTEVVKTETEVNGDSSESSKSATATLVIDHKTDEIHRLADVAKIENVKLTEREQAAEIIKGFVEQKEERLNQVTALNSEAINEIMSSKDIKKLENIVNTGMMNAGVVLSQLVGKEVELFIPEIKLTDREGLAKEFRYSMDQFFGMKIRMTGDLNGNLLMMFSEENGSEIAKELLGSEDAKYADGNQHKLSEDMVSVLSEISNIVCSSVMNSLSNKLKKEILPSVPEMITGSFMDVIDIVKPERTKFLSMHTEFNHQGSNLIGVLVFLPDFDELVDLIHKS